MLNFISDNRSRLERLAVEACAVALCLVNSISNFVPEDRSEAVQPHFPRSNLNVCAKRHYIVAAALLAREADVANHAANSSSRDQKSQALTPNLIELIQKLVVILNFSKLTIGFVVFL
jgi:hypothetical protein